MNENNKEKEDKVEEDLKAIELRYSAETPWDRLQILCRGINARKGTKEYKEAMIELQRLAAPALAVILPILSVFLLILLSNGSEKHERLIETQVMEAEKVDELQKLPEDEPLPDAQPDTMDTALTMDINSPTVPIDTAAPASAVAVSPQPVSIDAVMQIRSPVMLRNIYGVTRNAGTRGSALARYGGDAKTEACVLRALRWIKAQQQPNGSWKGHGDGTSVTGFAVLAFLAHGETPGNSKEFGDTVQRGIEYLMTQPHHDAMATHALAEAYGMTQNPNIKTIAMRSLNQMADRLTSTKWGPERDGDGTTRPNLLNMTFNVMALRSAKLSHIEIPNMENALKKLKEGFLVQGNKKDGGFCSDYFGPPGPNYRRTGTWHFIIGVVGMQYLGAAADPIIEKTLDLLDDIWEPPTLGCTDIACCPVRGNYWATMVFFNQGGKRWEHWNKAMREVYVKGQHIEADKYKDPDGKAQETGYWTCEDMHIGEQPLMPTCYIAQQLMVYYRYLPTSAKEVWDAKGTLAKASSIDTEDISVDSGTL